MESDAEIAASDATLNIGFDPCDFPAEQLAQTAPSSCFLTNISCFQPRFPCDRRRIGNVGFIFGMIMSA